MPQLPALGVRQHDEVDHSHDLLERKTLDHGDDHRERQVEEMKLEQRGDAPSPHGQLSI